MDNKKIARELVKVAKSLVADTADNEYDEHKKLWDDLDRQLEKYQDFVRKSNLQSLRKKELLKSISALIKDSVLADSAFYKATESGGLMHRLQTSSKKQAKNMLEELKQAVENAGSFMDVGKALKEMRIKYDFTTEMLPMYMIKDGSKTWAILNKKYVDDADVYIGDIAIGEL